MSIHRWWPEHHCVSRSRQPNGISHRVVVSPVGCAIRTATASAFVTFSAALGVAEGSAAGSRQRSCCSRTRRSRIRFPPGCGTMNAPREPVGPRGGDRNHDGRRIDDWSLRLAGDVYTAHVVARDFAFTLTFAAHRGSLQGGAGVSAAGSRDAQASSITAGRSSRSWHGVRGRSYAQGAERRGSITSGRVNISPRTRAAGIGSASISTTAAHLWRFASVARMAATTGPAVPFATHPEHRARSTRAPCASRRRNTGVLRARASTIRSRFASKPVNSISPLPRCSRTRNSIRGRASAPCTGRCGARARRRPSRGRGYLELTGYGGALKI